MKLVRFSIDESAPLFGVVIDNVVLSFETLMKSAGRTHQELSSIESYLGNLPRSEDLAREIIDISDMTEIREKFHVDGVRLLAPLSGPPALIDFGLSPRHLKNSSLTIVKYTWGALAKALLTPLVKRKLRQIVTANEMLYYKCNHNAIIGDGDVVGWPRYTSYLDIEPELGIVAGTEEQPVAGYLIYNDVSARDVQLPEMFGTGPARSKDFDRSQGLGPFLVTPDEIPDPLALDVTAKIGERFVWNGSTSEYTNHPEEVVRHVRSIFTPLPGTIIGMGTIPDCTGLDNDEWLCPGDMIQITFTGLGTLRQQIPTAPVDLEPSRWKTRPELKAPLLGSVTLASANGPLAPHPKAA
jgi:2-keto-4-pentenoate hydratase/2-oxohepta-3-ene-1,7-dioic acid hydratase in catechol pathway